VTTRPCYRPRSRERSYEARAWPVADDREPRRWTVLVHTRDRKTRGPNLTGQLVTHSAQGWACTCADPRPCAHIAAVTGEAPAPCSSTGNRGRPRRVPY
jgi:hypothetical protein